MSHGTRLHEEKTQEAGKVSYFIHMLCTVVSYGLKQFFLEVGGKFLSEKQEEKGGERRGRKMGEGTEGRRE